jgi:predicted nucleic acid-binding protein
MAEIVLDANVLVAWFDKNDVHHARALALIERLEGEGHTLVLLDVVIGESVSVLCRRARERQKSPPDVPAALMTVRRWAAEGAIRWMAQEAERLVGDILDVMEATGGRLNFNDALLVALQREGSIHDVASFDQGFDAAADFRRIG